MKLYIEHKGELYEVEDSIEDFNLDKVFAMSHIVGEIQRVVNQLKTKEEKTKS